MNVPILSFLSFLLLLSQINTQQEPAINMMFLDQKYSNELNQDESHEYYMLKIEKIPPNTIQEQQMLTFYIEENKTDIEDGKEIFSDPDVYVSKKNKYPSDPHSSEWYSERYGNDILTISDIKENDIFYVGVYCQFKCRYTIIPSIKSEVELAINQVRFVSLPKNSRVYYYIPMPNIDYEEFTLFAKPAFGKTFRIFMSNESASTQNTFKMNPVFINGYYISIDKKSKYYCINCIYHIIIQSPDQDTEFQIYATFKNEITKLSSGFPIYDSVKIISKKCYYFELTKNEKENSEIIVQIILYNGNGFLIFHGWENDDCDYSTAAQKNNTYVVNAERTFVLSKKDFQAFDDLNSEYKDKNSKLYFCFYARSSSSFYLTTYDIHHSSILQIYNSISPERQITGYLKNNSFTKYKILDYSEINLKNKANISITVISSNLLQIFGYYSKDRNLYITKKNFEEELKDKVIKGKKSSYNVHQLLLKGEENECYKFRESNQNDKKKEFCDSYVIIFCEENNKYCEFKLKVSISESSLLMTPKTTYYSMISSNNTDLYQIRIDEPSLASLVIVLNSISGDAQLIVHKINEKETDKDKKLVGISFNSDFIPDVVRITPKKLNNTDIIGLYNVTVKSVYFSTYSIYYYTTYEKKNDTSQVTENDVTSNIENGLIITDYFPNDIDYKIYSYFPNGKNEDIKMVLSCINVRFSFKVFLNLTKFNYTKNPVSSFEEKLKGYDWVSDSNGELLITSNDRKFSKNNPYYIVVYKDEYTQKIDIDKNAVIKFYLGVSTNNSHFLIFEGLEQTLTLTDNYKKQDYWYVHNDKNKPFELSINILSGAVHLFLNTSEISEEKIKDILQYSNKSDDNYSSLRYIMNIKDYDSIILDKNYFNKYCEKGMVKDKNSCSLYIKVIKNDKIINGISYAAQYMIVGKSSLDGEYLFPGIARKDIVKVREQKYYIIEEIQRRKGSVISVVAEDGYIEIYAKVLDTPRNKSLKFPNQTNYDYIGNDYYIGQILHIPEKEFQKINSEKMKLTILITIVGNSFSSNDNQEITYIISYSSDPKRINQNTPYNGYVLAGEFHYYKFFFDKNTTNIYIGLSNMVGDADLYLNYGDEELPIPDLNDWNSTNLGHEYINLNLEDEYFKKNNKTSLQGYYTLLIVGYTSTSYTLFVSNYDKTVYPLYDNIPMTCKCAKKGDKCYFRYDDVYDELDEYNTINETAIIFVTQYLYGDGMMYAKVMKDEDLYKIKDKLYDNFPDEKTSDFSTNNSNQKNYMKVKVSPNKYFKDSLILMTLICDDSSEVNVNTASLWYYPGFESLDYGRENIYYLKYNNSADEQPETILFFYKNQENDLLYNIHTYVGKAHVKVYINESYYDKEKGKYVFKYLNISEFDIDAANSYGTNSLNEIHKSIKNSNDTINNTIYFSVIPKSDVGFFVHLIYDNSFVSFPIGKNNKLLIKNNMVGYFDILDEYSNIEFSFSLLDSDKKCKAVVYIKINTITKDSQNIFSNPEKSYHYIIPNEYNYDYKMETDPILKSLLINIDDFPKINNTENKFIRALFSVELLPINDSYYYEKIESTAKIIVSPGMSNIIRVTAEPYQYYFNNVTVFKDNDNIIKKIFALERINSSHTKMIIEISTCSGEYEFSLSNKINLEKGNLEHLETTENGRKIIIINDLKDKHIYLSIWPKKNIIFVKKKQYLSYMMFYYTSSEKDYQISFIESTLTYKPIRNGGIKMTIPQIKARDNNNNIIDMGDYVFSAFITVNADYYNHMESVCYLTRYFDKVDPKKFFRNVNINKNNEISIKDIKKGQSYYVNILAKNSKTNELITFKPIVVTYGNSLFSYWKITAMIILIILIVLGLIYLIKRIRRVEVLAKEVQNASSTTVKTDTEMTYVTPSANSDNKL